MAKLTAIGTALTMVFLILITAIAPRETYAGPVTVAGDNYILEFNHIYFEVNAQIGGRITTFSLDGKNVLTGPSVNPDNYGSTFWTSPQSDWDWPPIPEIDNLPYEGTVEGDTIILQGQVSPELGVSITKEFSPDLANDAIVLHYSINNESAESVTYAPWEISRVGATDALVFYPTGEGGYDSGPFDLPKITEARGITWVQYHRELSKDQKLFADGSEGWLASLTDRQLFIRSFVDIPPEEHAPGEGEIEIYFNGPTTYVEVEPQGPYQEILPGESLSWTVTWYLRNLPPKIPAKVGSKKLIKFVQRTVDS